MAKILCPAHKDTNPSMEVYSDSAYCFVCGFTTREITGDYEPKPKTDIGAELEKIRDLPTREIRGLQLHFDIDGYYVVWPPGVDFYKKRLFGGAVRYVGPRGHRPPLLTIPGYDLENLIVVEGEINALSLSHAIGNRYTIASYGAASNFSICIPISLIYNRVYAIIDKDIAGVDAGLKLKNELIKKGKTVHLIATERDVNQILQDGGKQAVKEFWDTKVGLPT